MQVEGRRSRLSVFSDWIDTVALAFGAGLLASLALGLIALLLTMASAQAQERPRDARVAEREAAERDGRAGARDGLLLRSADGQSVVAPLVHTDVQVRVSGFVARTRVSQRFKNPTAHWQEGVYVFPLPTGAAVDRLGLRVGERVIEGEIRERQAANRAYAEAKQAGQRAALVEGERPNVFTTSVANIAPSGEITVSIEYQETLAYDQGTFRLRFPMVVGPRYVTATVEDATRILPPVMNPGETPRGAIHNPVNLRIDIDAGMPLAGIYSPHHKIVVSEEAGRYRIALAEGVVPANRDFELAWQPQSGRAPQAAVFQEERDGARYALVMVVPPSAPAQTLPGKRIAREAIFVIDTSGSMEGTSIVQAREALALALDRLQSGDRFNVIEFNSHARAMFERAVPASRDNVDDARRWVRALRANGGTEIGKALDLALPAVAAPREDDGGFVRQVIFLTDGAVGNEDELLRMVRARLGASRLFTVGIGSAPNSFIMTKLAEEGRGTFTYIGKVEEVKAKMGELFAKLESPLVKNVRIDWPAGAKIVEAWPKQVPDLYAGEPIVVTARLPAKASGAVTIQGISGDTPWQQTLKLADEARLPVEDQAGVAKLWAGRKIHALMDEERLSSRGDVDAERVKGEIVKVALEHHLVSKYTALVAVDKTPARPQGQGLQSSAVPTNLPEGWVHEAVFGQMPATATPATLHAIIGMLLLMLATLLWRLSGGALPRRAARSV